MKIIDGVENIIGPLGSQTEDICPAVELQEVATKIVLDIMGSENQKHDSETYMLYTYLERHFKSI